MADQQIPVPGDVIGKAIDRIALVRPSAVPHLEQGRYGTVVVGWRGQYEVARRRLLLEVLASRLPTATGVELSELTQSEYETPRASEPVLAVGEVELTRSVIHYRRFEAISTANATDATTVEALIRAIEASFNSHMSSVYDPATGLGAHVVVNAYMALPTLASSPLMYQMVAYAEVYQLIIEAHYANEEVDSVDHDEQNFLGNHPDNDTVSSMAAFGAFISDGVSTFDGSTLASQQSLLTAVNAIKDSLNTHYALEARAGCIRKGTRYAVRPIPTAIPPVPGGEYAVVRDTTIAVGSSNVTTRIEAIREGAASNIPLWVDGTGPTLEIVGLDALFDAASALPLAPTDLRAAGGSSGQLDPELRRAASAYASGRYGPTNGALVAGALRGRGVSRIAVRDDYVTAHAVVYAADASWAQSDGWVSATKQALHDDWRGTGCRIAMGRIRNRPVRADLVVVLRNSKYLADTSEFTALLQKLIRGYFDDRQDFWIWRAAAIRALASRADRRFLSCTSAIIRDADDVPLTEPAQPAPGDDLTHYAFDDNALTVAYAGPS